MIDGLTTVFTQYLPTITQNTDGKVLTSSGISAEWEDIPEQKVINDNVSVSSANDTVVSTLGVFNYTQPKIINLEVSNNDYIEVSGADFRVNGDTSLNNLDVSGDFRINGVLLDLTQPTGDVTIDASYVNVDVCLNVTGDVIVSGNVTAAMSHIKGRPKLCRKSIC